MTVQFSWLLVKSVNKEGYAYKLAYKTLEKEVSNILEIPGNHKYAKPFDFFLIFKIKIHVIENV